MMGVFPPNEPSNDEIDRALSDGYIDYLNGRCIKTDFGDLTQINTHMYNRDAGESKFEEIVATVCTFK